MASVHREGPHWRAKWSVTVNQQRRQHSRTFATKREAEQFAQSAERSYEIRGVAAPQALSVASLVERFLAVHAARKRPATAHSYKMKLAYVTRYLGTVLLHRLTVSHLNDCFSMLLARGGKDGGPLSARTVSHVRRVAHKMLAFAVKE
jgi:hypothetical protein